MSKTLSLKLKDDVFEDTEDIVDRIHKSRNAYINEAVHFYNKFTRRKILSNRLKKESAMVSATSLEALHEMELIEDKIPE